MAETLDLEIQGRPGDIEVLTFERTIGSAVDLLREFDSAISGKPRGMLQWYIAKLSSNGHLLISFQSKTRSTIPVRKRISGLESAVTGSFITGFDDLENRCETPPYLSEFGLQLAGTLASVVGHGLSMIRFTSSDRAVEITSATSENVSKMLPIKRKAIGSVEGKLEAINLHRNPRVLVYHSITNKAVTCEFEDDAFRQRAIELLGQRVTVFGTLHKNVKGDTLRVTMERISRTEDVKLEVISEDWHEPEFASALSTAEYLRSIRGG